VSMIVGACVLNGKMAMPITWRLWITTRRQRCRTK
jgi:hypothetical protein